MEQDDSRLWRALGWGEGGAHVALEAAGRLGGIALAWRDDDFEKLEEWRGRHVVAAFLSRRMDGRSWVVASAYDPHSLARRMELWKDLLELATKVQGTPLIIGGAGFQRHLGGGGPTKWSWWTGPWLLTISSGARSNMAPRDGAIGSSVHVEGFDGFHGTLETGPVPLLCVAARPLPGF